ncbi:hypothetical protein C7460_1274 [Marinoscillum furvescens DSM 4134]|uniref:Uncharacterized protein n=1 Tax=Marinoscillum furvescens DSM 4134 TaxID=1122208 RepID=A0A3D9KXZ4_MARFU|nr:hypothetical protein C7460_1274 [Marinoscillum furvescens DSM 4134]
MDSALDFCYFLSRKSREKNAEARPILGAGPSISSPAGFLAREVDGKGLAIAKIASVKRTHLICLKHYEVFHINLLFIHCILQDFNEYSRTN